MNIDNLNRIAYLTYHFINGNRLLEEERIELENLLKEWKSDYDLRVKEALESVRD